MRKILLAALAFAALRAEAAEWYVAANGSDSSAGNAAAPLATLSAAIAKASAGDTIWIGDGTFSGGVTVSKNIAIRSLNGAARTQLTGGGATGLSMTAGSVRGLTIKGYTTAGVRFQHSAPGQTIRAQDCIFTSCAIGFNGAYSYSCAPPVVANCIFNANTIGLQNGRGVNCTFLNNTDRAYNSIYTQGTKEQLVNCLFQPDQTLYAPRATIYNTIFSSTSGSTVTAALLKNTIQTETTALDTTTYRPQATSPALNAGTTSSPYVATESDFSGNQRVNGTIDIGAVEWWLPKPPTPTVEIDEDTYSATITWSPVLDADQYQIAGETTAQTTIRLGNLVPGITCTNTIRAIATTVSNCQNWSESDTFTYTIPIRLDLSPLNPTAVFPAGTLDFNVASNWIWTIESDSNWATPLLNDHGFTLQYTRNEATVARTATLTLRSSTKTLTTTFTQTGYNQLPAPIAGVAANPFKHQVTIPLSQPDTATDLPVDATLVYTLDGTDPTLENAAGKLSGRRLALEATLTNDAQIKARIISSSVAYANSSILATNFFRAWLLTVDGAERGWHTKGASIRLEAPARTGYRFANWGGSIESTDNPLSFTMPSSDVSLSTAYSLLPPTLVSPASGATVKGQALLSIGHPLPVETVRWFLNGSQVAETSSTSFDATALVAEGENSWYVRTLIEGQWVDSPSARFNFLRTWPIVVDGATNSWHTKNETVQLSAPARTGYQFDHWSGHLTSSDNPISFTMPASEVILDTVYSLLPPTLSAPADGAETKGHVTLSITHPLAISAVRWYLNDAQVAETSSTTFDATAHVQYGLNSWRVEAQIDKQWVESDTASFTHLQPDAILVSPTGDNSDGLTWQTAFNTIQAAVDAAPSGGTVLVTNGTYSTGTVQVTDSATRLLITKSITIQSVEGAAKTILQGAGKEAYNTTNSLQTLTIEGANLNVHILGITFTGGANLFNNYGGAIAIDAQDSTIHLARCAIESSKADFGSALYAGGRGLDLTLSSCLICDHSGDYTLCTEAIDSQARIVNCTIVQNTNPTTPVYGFTVRNTLLAANSANTLNTATDEGNNHLTASTSLFTDPASHDYTLRTTATDCIDKGHTAAAVDALDLAGAERVQGAAVDIGAYEHPAEKTHTAQGTPYSWILAYYPDAADNLETLDLEDRDGDGFATYEEYIAGTDPTDPDSFLRATIRFDGDTCIIEPAHELPPGRIVEILGAPTLSTPFAAPTNAASRFFKIQLSLPD
ncbi:MAG: choice-of-anchor Q domain-containing protein [Kiritimatiellia bacterium]